MASAVNFFELSQLAEASYVDFSNPDVSPKDALINGKFSSIQADLFLADWQVVTGGHQPNTESGYSSTLFKNTDGSYVLAFRGTEGVLSDDFLTPVIPEYPLAGHLFLVFSKNQRIN